MTEHEDSAKVEQYVGEITGGMKPSMKLTIMGVLSSSPSSLTVSLLCSPVDPKADIALLLTINFQERSVTRNARIAEEWGQEEKNIQYFPFTPGENFKMEIVCEHQRIRVLVDGNQLCDFNHRVQQIKTVTAMKITGDARLTKVA
ncbi:galectin-related protein-like isoform X2 [Ambystoma mexicanum]|uniref:galectin-related protein-like isoform X2 n=1 Tax=Ambystoma mexicanum TaxID=8296 RepID=UPI0037E9B614